MRTTAGVRVSTLLLCLCPPEDEQVGGRLYRAIEYLSAHSESRRAASDLLTLLVSIYPRIALGLGEYTTNTHLRPAYAGRITKRWVAPYGSTYGTVATNPEVLLIARALTVASLLSIPTPSDWYASVSLTNPSPFGLQQASGVADGSAKGWQHMPLAVIPVHSMQWARSIVVRERST